MFSHMRGAVSALPRKAPVLLFVAALMLAAFAGGLYVARYKVFPYDLLLSARKTFRVTVETNLSDPGQDVGRFVDVPLDQAAARRFEFIGSDHLTDPILVPGGPGLFREYCPDYAGCLAVELVRFGACCEHKMHGLTLLYHRLQSRAGEGERGLNPDQAVGCPPRSAGPYFQSEIAVVVIVKSPSGP